MRSNKLLSLVFFLSVFAGLLFVPVCADNENHTPTMIIPTKFRYLMLDMAQTAVSGPAPAAPPMTPVPTIPPIDISPAPVVAEDSGMDEEALLAELSADQSNGGYGRGFVQTNFDVNFQDPGQKIDNRERLTARGLFNIHVAHEFN